MSYPLSVQPGNGANRSQFTRCMRSKRAAALEGMTDFFHSGGSVALTGFVSRGFDYNHSCP